MVFAQMPFEWLERWTGVIPLVVYYHGVSDQEVPHVRNLYAFKSQKQFKRDLESFLRVYRVIDVRELLSNLGIGKQVGRACLLLQFDDGFREIYDVVAPILWEKGIPATFFLSTAVLDNKALAWANKVSLLLDALEHAGKQVNAVKSLALLAERGVHAQDLQAALLSMDCSNQHVLDEIAPLLGCDFRAYLQKFQPYLTSTQIRKLIQMGFTIGAHSVEHPQYSLISLREQLEQTLGSMDLLCAQFGLNYRVFAFPNGDDAVSDEFFETIYGEGNIGASFGNVGKMKQLPWRHFARLPMEKQKPGIERVIGRFYAKTLFEITLGRRVVERAHGSLAKMQFEQKARAKENKYV